MTRRIVIAIVMFSALASVASAQTIERRIDLSFLGLGLIDGQRAEVDGNPATEEWVLWEKVYGDGINGHEQTGRWRVALVRSAICLGQWFDPKTAWHASVTVTRYGDRDKLVVREMTLLSTQPILTEVSLDMPASCEP